MLERYIEPNLENIDKVKRVL